MNKRVLSVIALLPAGLAGFFLAEGGMSQKAGGAEVELKTLSVVQGPVEADVVTITDGDTLRVSAMPWPDVVTIKDIRIRGVDTPEIRGACKYEKDLAAAAKSFVTELVNKNNKRVKLFVIGCNSSEGGQFGRCLATVQAGNVPIAGALIEKGLGRTNNGEARQGWCDAPK
jgi:endonuclease YncB( thermonuclease family)